jgi:hypothetical protein
LADFVVDQEQLIAAVAGLGAPFRFERSFRLSPAGLSPDRFLMSVTKEAIPNSPEESIAGICRDLQMPDPMLEEAIRELADAEFVHWGLEDDPEQRICKVYLEYPIPKVVFDPDHGPLQLHLAFKWNPCKPSQAVRTCYQLYPHLELSQIQDRLKQIYTCGNSSPSLSIADSILKKTAERLPSREIQYLEVNEASNPRRSFDLNLYDAELTIADLRAEIVQMANRFSQDTDKINAFVDQIRHFPAGHLAGGTHRNGSDFFNVYYGAEQWSGLPTKPNSVADGHATNHVPSDPKWLEHTAAGDRYFNYCWWPYSPVATVEHKLRPVNLLFHSFDVAGISAGAFDIVKSIQTEIGRFRTVWGTKLIGDRLAWEFYLYDYQRRSRDVSISRVLKSIAHIAPCKFTINETLPYFMFSIDIDDALASGQRDLDVVHMYVGNPGSIVSSGIAYAITATSKTLENFYFFFDGKRQLTEVADKIASSVHLDDTIIDINNVLRPELRECRTICVANKQTHDTAYFSGVNVDQLIFFLAWLQYPPAIRQFVETHRGQLDHLLYDVGFDYTSNDDDLRILKSGYYGVF